MNQLIPEFHADVVFTDPYVYAFGQTMAICLLGTFVFVSCGLVGNYLILRRLSLVGDAMSHSVLPGIVLAFVFAQGNGFWVFVGAILAGLLTAVLIEWLHRANTFIKQDVAIGITFTTLFALGVVLINVLAGSVHIDAGCVLWGDVEQVAMVSGGVPAKVSQAGLIAAATVALILVFYRPLLVTSFDSSLADSLGIRSRWFHYGLMGWLAVVVVTAFEAVGSILVVAAIVLPGATGLLLSNRLPRVMLISVLHGVLSSFLGYHLALALNGKVAAAMVVAGFILFLLAWLLSPSQGLVSNWIARRSLRKQARDGAVPDPMIHVE